MSVVRSTCPDLQETGGSVRRDRVFTRHTPSSLYTVVKLYPYVLSAKRGPRSTSFACGSHCTAVCVRRAALEVLFLQQAIYTVSTLCTAHMHTRHTHVDTTRRVTRDTHTHVLSGRGANGQNPKKTTASKYAFNALAQYYTGHNTWAGSP